MATRAEARSLSDINALAANPPQYPHSTERLDPLTLYMSRVPGSQDMILSTFRPQRKNVTSLEVENSLYYIHLETAADAMPPEPPSSRGSDESVRSTIRRKPLPGTAAVPRRRSVSPPDPNKNQETLPTSAGAHPLPPPPPYADVKPLPQRPAEAEPESDGYRPNPVFVKTRNPAHPLPPLPPEHREARLARKPVGSRSSARPSPATSSPFFLTIIRRDPTSGHQWNVGRVSSLHTNIPTPERAGPDLHPDDMGSPRSAPTVNVHLVSSGYAKYRGLPMKMDNSSLRPSTSSSRAEEGFSRTVEMAFSDSWTTNIKKAIQRVGGHARSRSHHDAADDNDICDRPQHELGAPQGDRPKGYVFVSPWGGQCKFRTGLGGRSLRCRHILDGGEETLGMRLAAAAGRARGATVSGPEMRDVSELRFDLPASDVLRSREMGGAEPWNQLDRWLRAGEHPASSDEEDMADLSGLGREKAGGGKRGSRAKLAKLIVHDEGQKMLDLVVAANVGVWWTVWERCVNE